MEKIISYLKRNIKLAFKTVTFHFKEYLCFYVAVLIIQTLFGIIIMSSANNIKTEEKEVGDNYGYHLSITGLNKKQYDYMMRLEDPDYDPNDYKTQVTPPIPTGPKKALKYVSETVNGSGSNRTYDLFYLFEDDSGTSNEKLYNRFRQLYLGDLRSLGQNFNAEVSPLYTVGERLSEIRGSCALWLVLLAAVSIVVLILLYNIRINHFKFTYGIYMSYGADSKTLFSTCFWEVMLIAWLTLLPSALVATVTDFLFFKLADYEYFFTPYLMLFGLVFMIPIVLIAVYVPVKATAVKPPLKLLLAEDNSNLVTSPRISFQMLGKKFPSAYEKLSFTRFKKYNAQVVLSSVLFAALFIWTSFYCTIYQYTTTVNHPEFVINFNQKKNETVQKIPTKGEEVDEFNSLRRALYNDAVYAAIRQEGSVASEFEKFYDNTRYIYSYSESTKLKTFKTIEGIDVTDEYNAARSKALKGDATEADLTKFEKYFDTNKYILDKTANQIVDKVYEIVIEEKVTVSYEGPTYTPEIGDELSSMSGIINTFKVSSQDAFLIDSFAMFQPSDVRGNSGFTVHPKEEKYTDVTIDAEYHAIDEEILSYIENNFKYTEVGDSKMSDILEYGSRVIISDSVNNKSALKIKPGDTIQIAILKSLTKEPTADDGLANDRYLDFLIEYGVFEYRQYIVCGVIENMSSDSNMVMYFSNDEYEAITGEAPLYKEVSVFVDQNMGDEAVNYLYSELRSWVTQYDYTSIDWNNTLGEANAERSMRKLPTFYTIAVMVLILSPIFWFFSQIMFYKKREKEFELLRGMGAIESEIKQLFLFDGAVMAAIGAVASIVLGGLGIFGMYAFAQKVMTYTVSGTSVKYVLDIPWVAIVIAVLVTAACGFVSSYLPYVINRRQSENKASEEFGD